MTPYFEPMALLFILYQYYSRRPCGRERRAFAHAGYGSRKAAPEVSRIKGATALELLSGAQQLRAIYLRATRPLDKALSSSADVWDLSSAAAAVVSAAVSAPTK